MRSKRIKAFLMAVVMTVTFLPLVPLPAKASATKAEIFFEDNKTTATVITGRNNISIITSVPNGYLNQKLVVQKGNATLNNDGIKFRQEGNSGTLSKMTIDPKFDPAQGVIDDALNPNAEGEGNYAMEGRYDFIGNSGLISWGEKADSITKGGTVILGENAAIQADSFCQIKCTKGEGTSPDAVPSLEFLDETKLTGFFAEYKDGSMVVDNELNKDPNKPKEIRIKLTATGKKTAFLTLRPSNMVYEEIKTDDQGNPILDADGKPVIVRDNLVRANTVFEISLELPRSTPLQMEVITPQTAMSRVEEQIIGSDGKGSATETNFIMLEKGDMLSEISAPFNVRTKTTQFTGADFKVEWEWDPTHIMTKDGKFEAIMGDKTQEQKDVIRPGSEKDGWKIMNVQPLQNDIKGKLIAKVTYYDEGGKPLPSSHIKTETYPVKEIVVLGKGTVTKVEQKGSLMAPEQPGGNPIEDKIGVDGKGGYKDITPGDDLLRTPIYMDAYSTPIDGINIKPVGPYEYRVTLSMGAQNSRAKFAKVDITGDKDAVTLQTESPGGNPEDYTPGTEIKNPYVDQPNSEACKVDLIITAKPQPADTPPKNAKLTISFTRWNQSKPNERTFTIDLNTRDSSPSKDSSLTSLNVWGLLNDSLLAKDEEQISYPFKPETTSYTGPANMVHLPYRFEYVQLTPTQPDTRYKAQITYRVLDTTTNDVKPGWEDPKTVKSGQRTEKIPIKEEEIIRVEVTVTAPDPNYTTVYTLDIKRDAPSTDDTLSSLGLYFDSDTDKKNNLIKFDPKTEEYQIEIPYSAKRLRVLGTVNDKTARGPIFTPALESETLFGEKQWLNNLPKLFAGSDTPGILDFKAIVVSEKDQKDKENMSDAEIIDKNIGKTYTVHIHRMDPNDDPTLKALEITNTKDEKVSYTPAFKADGDTYALNIPFTDGKIKVNVTPNDINVNNILIYDNKTNKQHDPVDPSKDQLTDNDLLFSLEKGEIKLGAPSPAMKALPLSDESLVNIGYHSFIIRVIAEDEHTAKDYELRVQREEASDDAHIKSLILKDQEGVDIKTLAFHPDETNYELEVPFETTGISFTPTTNHPSATMRLYDGSLLDAIPGQNTLTSGMTSKVYKLDDPGKVKEFKITVKAEDCDPEAKGEDGTTMTYIIKVKRGMPSSDALLKNLQAANIDDGLKPQFLATKKDYSATVSEGAQGVTITATANHPGATIKINGNVATSGQPSELIELIEVEKTIEIEVTAQDGTTKNLYRIKFTNQNLIEKTSNADLKQLIVDYGQMTPNFQSAVTEYEVAVTEKTYSVDIIPQPADPLAEVKVFSGSKEIGDYGGNYAQALVDGQNDITVKVTSPDKTVTKDYTLAIFRNEEDQLKNLKPLEASDIDFENSGDVILVMIDEYPRVGASVFNELKKYPEKTIIFQGNDYSLKFNAADLTKVIPQAEIYDFRMSFTSPDKEAIYDIIDSRTRNDDIINRTVMMYFWYHGSLPGPATLNVSLGSKYASDTLYWHYYNQERDRIDYYGYLRSNNKGTIAVTVDHFSTYILTPKHRIAGSEDKQGVIDELGQSNGSSLNSSNKTHPYTGAQEGKS